jgi:hypothetical protein
VEKATDLVHPDSDAGLRRLETSYESAQVQACTVGVADRPATIEVLVERNADGSAQLTIRPVRRKSSGIDDAPKVLTWAGPDMDGACASPSICS